MTLGCRDKFFAWRKNLGGCKILCGHVTTFCCRWQLFVVTSGHQLFVATRQHVNFSVHDVVYPRADRKSGARKMPSGGPKKCHPGVKKMGSGGSKKWGPDGNFRGSRMGVPGPPDGGRKPRNWPGNPEFGGWVATYSTPCRCFQFPD